MNSPGPRVPRCGARARRVWRGAGAALLGSCGSLLLVFLPLLSACVPESTLVAPEAHCRDGRRSGDESDVDCGGSCRACGEGASCSAGTDCLAGGCSSGRCPPIWPFGRDGGLVVAPGQTVTLDPGRTHDFASVTVETGGVLELAAGGAWGLVGVRGSLVLDGELRARNGEHAGGTFEARAPGPDGTPTGEVLSYSIEQAPGGNGGFGEGKGLEFVGLALAGNGGGGSGGSWRAEDDISVLLGGTRGGDATLLAAGDGGASYKGVGLGGAGGALFGQAGKDGLSGEYYCVLGGGGGGGSRGRHGQGLYLHVVGSLSGSGVIDLRGSDGGAGGQGGLEMKVVGQGAGCRGGAGGGGGAGGSGGRLVIRTGGSMGLTAAQFLRFGGIGGKGGAKGNAGDGAQGDDGPPPDTALIP
jgi:hypothetical protein